MRLDDHVRIASITKTFVATVVLQLVAEGMLSLDDRLGPFITGIPNGDEITLRQLLNMTAGIYNYIYDPVIAVDYDRIRSSRSHRSRRSRSCAPTAQADFAPGHAIGPTPTPTTSCSALIIEQVTGRRSLTEITERILVPLGLTQTSFATTPEMPEPYAHGYAADRPGAPLRDVTRSNVDVPWAAGADDLHHRRSPHSGPKSSWPARCSLLSLQAERLRSNRRLSEPIHIGYGLGIQEIGRLARAHRRHHGLRLSDDARSGDGHHAGGRRQSRRHQAQLAGGIIFGKIADLLFPGRGFASLLPPPVTTPVP